MSAKYSIYQTWYNIPFLDSKDMATTLDKARAKAIEVISHNKTWDDMMILTIDGKGNTKEVGWVLGKTYSDGKHYVWEPAGSSKRYILDRNGHNTRKLVKE